MGDPRFQLSTFNFQRSTSYFWRLALLFSDVFILAKNIFINSSVSDSSGSTFEGGLIIGMALISLLGNEVTPEVL